MPLSTGKPPWRLFGSSEKSGWWLKNSNASPAEESVHTKHKLNEDTRSIFPRQQTTETVMANKNEPYRELLGQFFPCVGTPSRRLPREYEGTAKPWLCVVQLLVVNIEIMEYGHARRSPDSTSRSSGQEERESSENKQLENGGLPLPINLSIPGSSSWKKSW